MKPTTRRGFLSGTAGAIAASGAALLPSGEVQARMPELEQMAQALHKAVGRYADKYAPMSDIPAGPYIRRNPLDFAMENLRDCSVDQIQDLLKPLFEGGAS